ncbi:MAG: FkbM family methyltransferase [Bacteroidota bacterium]
MRRIINNIKHHSNWLQYYSYKYFTPRNTGFTFIGRSGLKLSIPKRLLQTYKECFFDETYFKGLPKDIQKFNTKTVVDIGANVGYFSLSFFSIDPKAQILSYEPMPNNFELLQKYQNENAGLNFKIFNNAVSGRKETLTLNYNANDSYTTSASIFESDNEPDKIYVETTTLEDIIKDNQLEKIDFLKLDCEGSEYEIIYNASSTVLDKIVILSIETHQGKSERENRDSLATFLIKNGFEIKSLKSQLWGWKSK